MKWETQCCPSLKVLKYEKFELPTDKKKQIPQQTDLTNNIEATGEIDKGKTDINFEGEQEGLLIFSVDQYTDAIKEPIRVRFKGYDIWPYGYQKTQKFTLIQDKNDKQIYIFTNSAHTGILLSRLKKYVKNDVILSTLTFDFFDLPKLKEIQDIWGVWQNIHSGRITIHADFGHQLDQDNRIKLKTARSVNLTIIFKNPTGAEHKLDFILSKDGRITCLSRDITKKQLLHLYKTYFSRLLEK